MKRRNIILILFNAVMMLLIGLAWFLPVNLEIASRFFDDPIGSPSEKSLELASMEEEDIALLKELEYNKVLESIALKERELKEREEGLKEREQKLQDGMVALAEEKTNLSSQKEKLQRDLEEKESYENRLSTLAGQFTSMPPEQAVERLLAIDDDLFVIDILNTIDRVASNQEQNSIVPYFISLMPKEDASRILRKSVIQF